MHQWEIVSGLQKLFLFYRLSKNGFAAFENQAKAGYREWKTISSHILYIRPMLYFVVQQK